jgi:aspartyl-tRNA(Asn)/glutamyl-tRNA(Gln) amidotransferase subunit B
MAERFQRDDGLPAYDAAMMTQSLAWRATTSGGAPAASPSWPPTG